MGNPQPSPKGYQPMDAVQRLSGSGRCWSPTSHKI